MQTSPAIGLVAGLTFMGYFMSMMGMVLSSSVASDQERKGWRVFTDIGWGFLVLSCIVAYLSSQWAHLGTMMVVLGGATIVLAAASKWVELITNIKVSSKRLLVSGCVFLLASSIMLDWPWSYFS